jgi:phosphate:Na+ symporter
MKENNSKFSDAAVEEIKRLSDSTIEIADTALDVYENKDESQLAQVESLEEEIDRLSIEFSENQVVRLRDGTCELKNGVIFTDIINDLERIGDHANNIAFYIK